MEDVSKYDTLSVIHSWYLVYRNQNTKCHGVTASRLQNNNTSLAGTNKLACLSTNKPCFLLSNLFVIGVNRVGDDPVFHYDGGSAIIDAKGNILIHVPDNTAATATAILDMESLNAFRKEFPVLQDADA